MGRHRSRAAWDVIVFVRTDQLIILMQAAVYLAATRSAHAPEARICNERAEALCRSLNRPRMLYVALIGQWRQNLVSLKLQEAMQIATRMYSLNAAAPRFLPF